jgi:hypothetical protein
MNSFLSGIRSIFKSTPPEAIPEPVEATIDAVRLSVEQRMLDALMERYRGSNTHHLVPINEGRRLQGVLMLHYGLEELVQTGRIPEELESGRLGNGMARSILVLTENKLNNIQTTAGRGSWFPDPLSVLNMLTQVPDWLRDYLPSLGNSETSEIAKRYNESAYHLLTHDKRAEIIWAATSDLLSGFGMQFDLVRPVEDPLNGNDGGIDDLRRTAYGHLATQVKGGKTLVGFATAPPHKEAQKFFNVNGLQPSARALKQRTKLYPFLINEVHPGITMDDLLTLHYLALGKRILGEGITIRGHSGGRERSMYVTGPDVIVLKPARHYRNRQRVDASASSKPFIKTLEADRLIESATLDVPS